MINLMPTDVKEEIVYSRHNTVLAKWALALIGTIVGVVMIVAFGLFYMDRSINHYSGQIQETQKQLKAQKLEETQKRVDEISNSLKLSLKVLSREVLFSELIKQIGSAMPASSSLTDLRIGKIEGGIDLTAVAADYNTATQVQVNLSDPSNKIFDKADIVNITCTSDAAVDPRYPCTVNIRASFAKNNPFLFISNRGS